MLAYRYMNTNETNPAPIAMEPVDSSQIEGIGYNPLTQTLAIKFKRGGVYHYSGFPPAEWARFKGAESIGSHFYRNIKGKYDYTKQ